MGRKFYLPLIAMLFIGIGAFAQSGEIRGKVTEKGGKEGVPFASVAALLNGTQIQAAVTDFDGNFSIKPLNPGKYDVKATCVGYNAQAIQGVLVTIDKISFANLELGKGVDLGPVEIVDYEIPLIDKGSPATQKTVSYEEIQAAPTRDVASIASQSAGVFQKDDGSSNLNIRGSRSDATSYYVDGMKVRGGLGLPQKGTEQITVITGGVPAQYGDATGGIISVTTRGPSKQFSGGVEFVTSELFDEYGYNLASLDLSGPIFTKKDSTGQKSGQPVAGFFLSAEYQYDKDPSPSAAPFYVVKEDVLESARKNPLILSPTGFGYIHRSSYYTMDSLEKVKARPNVAANAARLNGKIDIRPAKNVTLTMGGSIERTESRDYIDIYSLMNYDNNPQTIGTNWRAFAKLTQRFTSEAQEKASTGIKNAFYSIQVDYSHGHSVDQNALHKDKIFDYGYVGKFTAYGSPGYQVVTLKDVNDNDSLVFNQVGAFDTLVTFEPGSQNPNTSNYTTQYYDLTSGLGAFGYQDNLFNIINNGALINNDNRLQLNTYGLWATPGRTRSFYGIDDQSQFRISASGSADLKNHNIVVGIEYEQRTDRAWSVNPNNLWGLMRQLANSRITGVDPNSAQISYGSLGNTPITLVNYSEALYDPSSNIDGDDAPGFYEKVREQLGFAMNDTIQVDAIDPSRFSLSMFTPDELLSNGLIGYYGYDYLGNMQKNSSSIESFYRDKNSENNYIRPIDAFRPNYIAGYIQDRFTFNDLIFNIGVRVDRFDANQSVLKDKYLIYQTHTAGDQEVKNLGNIPDNIGSDYYVYVNNSQNPTQITGFRKDDKWYDAIGNQITDLTGLVENSGSLGGIQPYLVNYDDKINKRVRPEIFKDYSPQVNVMPRIAFSFPISDEAYFAAHYDILTQRPQDLNLIRFNPVSYQNLAQSINSTISNPDLKPERTTDYEIVFQQKISRSSAFSIAAFYKELRDMIQYTTVQYAYPITYSTYGNLDFGTVKGLTFSYDLRRTGNIRMNVSYTLQFADGTGSDANASAGILAQQGQTNLRETLPLSFDQRHMLVTSFDYHYASGKNYDGPVWFGKQVFANAGVNFVVRAGSGTPYTRKGNITPEADFTTAANGRSTINGSLNGSRYPWQFKIDAKVDKDFEIKLGKKKDGEGRRPVFCNVYLQVLNLLDAQNVISVYRATGSPDDDGYLASAGAQPSINQQVSPQAYIDLYTIAENNPGNYSLPRRIRLGVQLNF
ncbi:MAG: carboxypeptidase-like regulatory domain-containing protein [Bacteroidetes bacterium]|nr:carboxypeptidase-like regulatory domain-containing protein [Bacteroidota bacterium]MBP6648819.1 carboxypeptidase-like regulatory domain-containing protein [Bacteroidia bacterium]